MATHITGRRQTGRSVLLVLALVIATSTPGVAQKGVPQEPGQGQPPKSGGQGSGGQGSGGQGTGVSTGVGVDVGEVIGLFRHHAKVQLQASQQQVRAGDPIVFTATVTPNRAGLSYEFHWTQDKPSPGQQEITPTVNHAYTAPGQYTANVIVYAKGKKVGTSNDVAIVVQQPSSPAGGEVGLRMSLQPNQVKSATIIANNQCNQQHRWEVVSQSFPAFMHFTGDWSFDVNAHSKHDLPMQFDSNGLKQGVYDGTVIIRCLTCKATDCNQVRSVVNVHLTVEPPLVAANPGAGANSTPTPSVPGNATSEPVKTASVPPATIPPEVVAPPAGTNTASPASGNNQAPPDAGSGHPQEQNAKGAPNPVGQPNSSVSTPPVNVKAAGVNEPGPIGTSASPDKGSPVSLPYSVSLHADSRTATGEPANFSADLYPIPPSGKPVRYCFAWGDGSPQNCQDSPAATHIYRSRGRYLASVEVFADQEKLAASIQIEAALPVWLKALIVLALVLLILATAYGTHRARKVIKAAVSVKADFGNHKITPAVVESGEGLHIRCVRSVAVSTITFSSSGRLIQEKKETANV